MPALQSCSYKSCSEICSKFTAEHPCQSVILIKSQSNFIEIALRHECSPANLLHIFRTSFIRAALQGCFLNDAFSFYVFAKKVPPNPKSHTAQKMKFFIMDFFSKCDQIRLLCNLIRVQWFLAVYFTKLKPKVETWFKCVLKIAKVHSNQNLST